MKYTLYILFFFLLIGSLILSYFYVKRENYENNNNNNSEIPLNVFLTWKTKELPPKMQKSVDKLKRENPEFTYHLFDDNDCHNFIKENFNEDVANAYDSLIPGAFKADLWRYCVLYKRGGIYLDIKYHTVNGFKLINLTDKEYFIRDIEASGSGIYNAFMICKPGNQKMYNCITKIIENVKNKYYGNVVFEPTGPLLLLKEFNDEELRNLPPIGLSEEKCPTKTCISMNNVPILAIYKEYREEQKAFFSKEKTKYYYDLWNERKIYKE
uniref:Glycosyltransferase n=1 Tax=viral metagenome TaxID=1070528 RepID=A0A6C0DPN3_9ZZZZ